MSFGASCAANSFQKAQQYVVSGFQGVRCLADNIVFECGDTKENGGSQSKPKRSPAKVPRAEIEAE